MTVRQTDNYGKIICLPKKKSFISLFFSKPTHSKVSIKLVCSRSSVYELRKILHQFLGKNIIPKLLAITPETKKCVFKTLCPNHMPDPKGEWSLKENNSELHYGIRSIVYQFIYTLVCNYIPIIRILAKAVLRISRSKSCSYTKCLCPKKESNATENSRNRFKC